jgi:exportin-1
MTQQKTNNLKNQMCGEFSEIYQLCKEVLDRAQKTSLIKATLQTLLRFLNWIPLGFIFETDLIDTLTSRVSCNTSALIDTVFFSANILVSSLK